MSAGAAIQAAVVAALRARVEFAEVAVFDAVPVRVAVPYALVADPELADWSTKDWTGRSGKVAVTLHGTGERPMRVRALMGAVAETVEALAGELGAGWRSTGFRLARERLARTAAERWTATSEFAVRIYRVEG